MKKLNTAQQDKPISLFGLFITLIGASFYFYETIIEIVPNTMVEDLMRSFHLSGGRVGILDTCYFIMYAFMQIPGGSLLDRYGARRLLSLAGLACAIGLITLATTHTFAIAIISRFITGFGGTFGLLGAMYLVNKLLPQSKLAFFLGLTIMIGLSGGLFQQNLSHLVTTYGWRHLLFGLGVCGALFAIIAWIFIRDKINQKETEHYTIPIWPYIKSVLNIKAIWPIAIFGGLMYLPTGTLGTMWGIEFLKSYYQHDPKVMVATMTSALFLGWIIGSPIAGWISDQIHKRRLILLVGVSGVLACLLIMTYIHAIPATAMLILWFFLGLFSSCSSITFAMGCEITSKDLGGTAIGFINMLAILPSIIVTPLFGFILDHFWQGQLLHDARVYRFSTYQQAMILEYGLVLVALFIAYFFIKEQKK